MEYKDYYATLGVDKNASQDDIKHAYRRLARKFHPDVSKEANAEEKFKNLQEAYEVLKDTEKRTAYDQLGSNWKQGQDFRPPPGWDSRTHFYTSQGGGGQGFGEGDFGGFSDFFTQLFGRGRARGFSEESFEGFEQQQRGSDQQAKVTISLEEAFRGTTRQLQLQVPEIDRSGRMHQKLRTLNVTIPPGTLSGQQLRLSGQGGPGMRGPAGDLYLEIEIDPHALYTLKDKDVYLTLPTTPWEAALGATIKVPTLGGPVELKLKPGTEAGQKLRLKGRGMPGKPTSGDQYVIIQIVISPAQTEEEKEFYQKMAKLMPFNPRKNWPV